jgi:hypothetical protein
MWFTSLNYPLAGALAQVVQKQKKQKAHPLEGWEVDHILKGILIPSLNSPHNIILCALRAPEMGIQG